VIALDAGVAIAQLDETDSHHRRARRLLASRPADRLSVSTITLAEILVGPTRSGTLEVAEASLRHLEVEEVGLGPSASLRLASLRASTGLELPACCVLLAAQDVEADAIATFDDRLAAAARELGIAVAED
jgi:predicted nucleic acid-binding protein